MKQKNNSSVWRNVFDLENKKKELNYLEKELADKNLWNNKDSAIKKQKKFNDLKNEIAELESFLKTVKEIKKSYAEVGSKDNELRGLISEDLQNLKNKIKEKELLIKLSGKFDTNNAIIEISSGVGGRDAEDFVAMLLRMYQRFAERKFFKHKIITVSYGEPGGPDGRINIKNVSLEIKGKYAFGLLKEEAGSHRLVRQSPFSATSLRHTSFAQVEIFPIINHNDAQIEIKEEDLRIDTFRSSGPGGQHVNRRESAVRVTHLPSNIVVSCQSERLQGENKKQAINILRSKLEKITEEKNKEQQDKVREKTEKGWGTQIRNYVLHPYKLIKDLRTNKETSNVEEVLDGNIDLLKNDFFQ